MGSLTDTETKPPETPAATPAATPARTKKPKRDYPCIESTIDVMCGPYYTIRLWIDQLEVPEPTATADVAAFALVKQIRHWANTAKSQKELFKNLGTIPRINAAQAISSRDRQALRGVVVYYVDFDGDPHG